MAHTAVSRQYPRTGTLLFKAFGDGHVTAEKNEKLCHAAA
jgi:hypothetical protein